MIKLSEMLSNGGGISNLSSTSKEPVIDEILSHFCEVGKFSKIQKTKLKNSIMEREGTGSTGIGNGGAIPHCRIGKEELPVLYIGVASNDVEFQSIDGKPVRVIFVVILPKSNTEMHGGALKRIASFMKNERFFRYLSEVKTDKEIKEVIDDFEESEE